MVKKSAWKPVALDGTVISQGIEGLIGIEELTDYTIDRPNYSTVVIKGKVVKRKRTASKKNETSGVVTKKAKLHEIEQSVVSDDEKESNDLQNVQEKDTLKSKKKKKKKKKKQKAQVKKEELIPKNNTNDSDEHKSTCIESVTDETVPTGMEKWSNLFVPVPIIRALADLRFQEPTEIQSLALVPAIKGRRDILGAAETGSGKTLAFGIPIIYGILQQKKKELLNSSIINSVIDNSDKDDSENEMEDKNELQSNEEDKTEKEEGNDSEAEKEEEMESSNQPEFLNDDSIIENKERQKKLYALILTPTRELAIQVRDHLVATAKYTNIKIAVVVGGMASQKQERLLNLGPEIVIGTPGRLWELIQNGNSHLAQVSDIKFLAIDETDRMLEKGHFQELQVLLEKINMDETKKKQRQNFVFSATLTLVHEPPKYTGKGRRPPKCVTPGQKLQRIISSLGITDPKIVDITQECGTAETLSEARVVCSIDEKDIYLYYFLLCHSGRSLVFCNSISCVRRLAQILTLLQCNPLPLHANMQQRQRLKNLERFRDSENGLLLATDVAARGLDIPNVEHVIHYQVPRTSEGYVHRSGRTARAKKAGLTLLLIEPSEVSNYVRLCSTLGKDQNLPIYPIDETIFASVKERVLLTRQVDQLELTSRRDKSQCNWFQKTAEDMDMIIDENEIPRQLNDESSARMKKKAKILRKQLENLLSKPIFSNRGSFKFPTRFGKVAEPLTKSNAVEVVRNNKKKQRTYTKIKV